MKLNFSKALLLAALPLTLGVASAQAQNRDKNDDRNPAPQTERSTITSFDRNGNPIIQDVSGDPTRSSITTFDRNGTPSILYTSPPLNGVGQPQSIAGLLANQNIYGQSAPNSFLGNYTTFGYGGGPIYPPGYGFPAPGYGFPAPGYGYPAPGFGYPVQNNAYTIPLPGNGNSAFPPPTITSIPLGPNYAYPAPGYGYPAPGYGYPAPGYGYPVPTYPYPYGYGYGNGTFSSNTAGYGVRFGRGGFSASIGGSNTTSRSSTTITVR